MYFSLLIRNYFHGMYFKAILPNLKNRIFLFKIFYLKKINAIFYSKISSF